MKTTMKYAILNIVIIFFSATIIAQEGFDDNTDDNGLPVGAPIDNYIIISFLIGTVFGFQKLKSHSKTNTGSTTNSIETTSKSIG
jgi:hypothetical protein